MEKVTVSKEVAEAIEVLRKVGKTDEEIARVLANPNDRWLTAELQALNEAPLVDVIKALFIGYEVEKTPEEIIRAGYEELCDYEPIDRACKDSVRFVLDTLGISIKGVNA